MKVAALEARSQSLLPSASGFASAALPSESEEEDEDFSEAAPSQENGSSSEEEAEVMQAATTKTIEIVAASETTEVFKCEWFNGKCDERTNAKSDLAQHIIYGHIGF